MRGVETGDSNLDHLMLISAKSLSRRKISLVNSSGEGPGPVWEPTECSEVVTEGSNAILQQQSSKSRM